MRCVIYGIKTLKLILWLCNKKLKYVKLKRLNELNMCIHCLFIIRGLVCIRKKGFSNVNEGFCCSNMKNNQISYKASRESTVKVNHIC